MSLKIWIRLNNNTWNTTKTDGPNFLCHYYPAASEDFTKHTSTWRGQNSHFEYQACGTHIPSLKLLTDNQHAE